MKKLLAYILSAAVVLGAVGVFYFDTYPTYIAKNVTLSQTECEQVATLVAAHVYEKQNPGEAQPEGALKIMAESTRLAKRVAKYIIEQNGEQLEGLPPMFVWMSIQQSCIYAEGKAELKAG